MSDPMFRKRRRAGASSQSKRTKAVFKPKSTHNQWDVLIDTSGPHDDVAFWARFRHRMGARPAALVAPMNGGVLLIGLIAVFNSA
jgi:hypothetical protein